MSDPSQKTSEYLFKVRTYVRSNGERFATVTDVAGAPSYYPTALMLSKRPRGISVKTMEATAADLIHVGLWALRERIDLNARLEAGAYFDPIEIETLAEACSVSTAAMRRITLGSVSEIRRGAAFTKADLVMNQQKNRRLRAAQSYFEFVGKMSEAKLPKRSLELTERVSERTEMSDLIKSYRATVKSSRIRGVIRAGELARVIAFVVTGKPKSIWPKEALARRNWALVTLLTACGLRQGEERQLKPGDIDLASCELRVERRHDDPDDPRVAELKKARTARAEAPRVRRAAGSRPTTRKINALQNHIDRLEAEIHRLAQENRTLLERNLRLIKGARIHQIIESDLDRPLAPMNRNPTNLPRRNGKTL